MYTAHQSTPEKNFDFFHQKVLDPEALVRAAEVVEKEIAQDCPGELRQDYCLFFALARQDGAQIYHYFSRHFKQWEYHLVTWEYPLVAFSDIEKVKRWAEKYQIEVTETFL